MYSSDNENGDMSQSINQIINKLESEDYFRRFETMFPTMDFDFMFRFARSMQSLHRLVVNTEGYFYSVGLSKARFMILVHLMVCDNEHGESISDILPYYKISSATMTGILDTLEKDNMITRVPNPTDRRRVNIKITENGRKFMFDFLPKHQHNAKEMSAFLTEEELKVMPVIFYKLNKGIEAFLEKQNSRNQQTED